MDENPTSEPADFSKLPKDFVVSVLERLPLCSEHVWKQLTLRRWQHWAEPFKCNLLKDWKQLYARRHELDLEVFGLLEEACFPQHQPAVYTRVMELGEDALDVLSATAHCSTSSMFIGLAYQVLRSPVLKLL
eukprot:gene10965-11120_t